MELDCYPAHQERHRRPGTPGGSRARAAEGWTGSIAPAERGRPDEVLNNHRHAGREVSDMVVEA